MPNDRETTPSNPVALVLALLVALLLGPRALGPSGGSSSMTSGVGPGEAAAPTPGAASRGDAGPLAPIRRFLNADLPGDDPLGWPRLDRIARIDFLVVTLPDPYDSHDGYRFDLTLGAVQQAVEDRGYVLDGYWLPWRVAGAGKDASEKSGDRSTPDASDPGRAPGMVLYRRADEDGDEPAHLLALFLVGETATSGVHVPTFQSAIRLGRGLREFGGGTLGADSRRIRVVGPYFSGSAPSIVRAIKQQNEKVRGGDREGRLHFSLVTGSATSLDPSLVDAAKGLGITFRSTILPDAIVLDRLFEYLAERDPHFARHGTPSGGDARKVALLTESDTYFGRHAYSDGPSEPGRDRDGAGSAGFGGVGAIEIKFPAHISDVRSKLDDVEGGPAGKEQGPPMLIAPFERIPLPTDDRVPPPQEVVPSLRPGMTTPSERLLLSKIFETISREEVRYVGIVASDMRDRIFLVRLIRYYFPDVQIFFAANDLLMSFPEYSRTLKGTIIASTYPLFSHNQEWSFPFRGAEGRSLFSQDTDEGYYNAALAQLNEAEPGGARPLLEYARPFLVRDPPRRPPVWIGVVGDRGVWPVRVEDSAPRDRAEE